MNKRQLVMKGLGKILSGFVLLLLLLFGPAGTFHFLGAWIFMGILFVPMFLIGFILLKKSPELLEKRLRDKEGEGEQKAIIAFSSLIFIATFLLAGFDYRYQWAQMPQWLMMAGAVCFVMTYALYAEVMKENAFLSRTVEIQENQKVVDTGLYGVVRHPMYMAVTFMFSSIPFVLGSWVAVLPMLFLPPILVWRIRNEEKVLEEGLPGYTEYKKKIRYRMIPYIW